MHSNYTYLCLTNIFVKAFCYKFKLSLSSSYIINGVVSYLHEIVGTCKMLYLVAHIHWFSAYFSSCHDTTYLTVSKLCLISSIWPSVIMLCYIAYSFLSQQSECLLYFLQWHAAWLSWPRLSVCFHSWLLKLFSMVFDFWVY